MSYNSTRLSAARRERAKPQQPQRNEAPHNSAACNEV